VTTLSSRSGGPRPRVTAPPLDLRDLGRTRAARAIKFVERYCVLPSGKGALRKVRLRAWQKRIIREVLGPGVRQGLCVLPRGNGKTSLAAFLSLWALLDGPPGARVLVVAGVSERQARLVWEKCRRMVELNDELAERVQVFQDRLYVPANDGVLAPLPAGADALQGFEPTFAVCDELAVVDKAVWEAVSLGASKRGDSTLLAISTPPIEEASVMRSLVDYGRAGADPAFVLVEYGARAGCALDDRREWRRANPALGDWLDADAMASRLPPVTREPMFRLYRLGQWVEGAGAWLEAGLWEACADPDRDVPAGAPIVLGFDGSYSRDSTALIGVTIPAAGETPHLFVVDIWERPEYGTHPDWRVDRDAVDAAVTRAFEAWTVFRMSADPPGWEAELHEWRRTFGAKVVLDWPTRSNSRMAPAVDAFYNAIVDQAVTHDGDERLARHVANCQANETPYGVTVKKFAEARKIDAAVAAAIGHHEAHAVPRPRRGPYRGGWDGRNLDWDGETWDGRNL